MMEKIAHSSRTVDAFIMPLLSNPGRNPEQKSPPNLMRKKKKHSGPKTYKAERE